MILYVIKSTLCMLLLWGFYVLLLEKENMHYTKRFYLLFSIAFSLIIPLITFTYTTAEIQELPEALPETVAPVTSSYIAPVPEVNEPFLTQEYITAFLWSIYGIGVLIFGCRFVLNLKRIVIKIRNNERLKKPSHTNVLLGESIVPHTFLHYIFLSKNEYQKNTIPKEVLLHEKTHAIQKHTLDILFIEILHVIFWFNPLFLLFKKSIKLNHEFLADQTIIKREFSLQTYMQLLVDYANNPNQVELSSPINYSLTKKRIVMMSKQFSKKRAVARWLLLLPMLLSCMLVFNNEIVAQPKKTNISENTVAPTHPDKEIRIRVKGEQITVNGKATPLSDFADKIDQETEQWKDDELTEFHFDVQIVNSDDGFMKNLNDAYRKTRLYKANPDGHDLVPPTPPRPDLPEIAKIRSSTPLPRKNKQSKGPVLPTKPPLPPTPPSYQSEENDTEDEDIESNQYEEIEEYQELVEEQEMALADASYDIQMAKEEANRTRERVMREAELSRRKAEELARVQERIAREQVNRTRAQMMRQAELSRRQAEELARVNERMAREEANRTRERIMREAELSRREAVEESRRAREESRKTLEESRKQAEKARKQAEKARKEVYKEVRKVREEAKKEIEKIRREARKQKN
ncbi:M56 family metallopeptidase [Aquimarina algicola]|uniref:Peptidase M56 domain-containing protein n=1 Tax=Aquimarina algicola TaxID=2589995 RepID=A0A504J8Y9_9FLAO|nr:M56 family metallopeptidase [Aquimarina algicola]TPN87366.1 hypothetical protein FHK87_07200 [Aquimarina algicola]